VALGAMEYTFGSAFDLRMWATDFIADSPYPADSEELSTLRKESPASAGPGSRWSGGLLRQAGTDSRCSTDVSGGAGCVGVTGVPSCFAAFAASGSLRPNSAARSFHDQLLNSSHMTDSFPFQSRRIPRAFFEL
jgi:hypothetical protein